MANKQNRLPWGHKSRHCVYCGEVGPRVIVVGGYAHKRCIPKVPKTKKPKSPWMTPALREHLAEIGRLGGLSRSARKRQACKRNLRKANAAKRPRTTSP